MAPTISSGTPSRFTSGVQSVALPNESPRLPGGERLQAAERAAREDVGVPGGRAHGAASRRADQQVGPAVVVHVAGGGDRGAERVAVREAGEPVDQLPGRAGVEVGATRVRPVTGCAGDDVGDAVAVDIARVGDRIALGVRPDAVEAVEEPAGAAGVDPGAAAARRRELRLADDDVGDAVVVDVAELAHGPAEVPARAGLGAGEGLQHGARAGRTCRPRPLRERPPVSGRSRQPPPTG